MQIDAADIKTFQKELTEVWEYYFRVMSQCFPILKDWLNRFVEKIRRGGIILLNSVQNSQTLPITLDQF